MAEAKEVSVTKKGLSLVCPSDFVYCDPGDDVVLPCHLEPAISAASMEIKWKIRADLVCHYKDGEMIESCEGRVSLSLEDLHNGNVSLTLRDVRSSQKGIYICEVIHERQTVKEYVFLHIRSVDYSLVVPTGPVSADPGSDVILPVHLSPETSAVSMDIRWFRRTEFIYQYMNRRRITNNDYDNRVSLSIQELERGNLSLTLQNVDQSDSGDYTCIVFHDGFLKIGVVHLQVRAVDFSLVVPTGPVSADPGSDVILPVHLSPETSAVSMDIRWFRRTEFIYQYMNRRRITNNDYDNRVSLSIQELERGNLSLTLQNVDQSDSGDYTCIVFHDGFLKIGVVHLQVRELQKKERIEELEKLLDDLRKRHEQLKTDLSEETLKLLQETLDNDGKDKKRKKEISVVLGPTPRRSNSTEGIRPLMGEDSTTETTTRRSNSTEAIRPLMGEDSTTETEFTEGPTLRSMYEIPPLMAMEFSGQNTRQTREVNTDTEQGFSTRVVSSPVLQRERPTVNAIMQTGQERRQESVATRQESSSSTVQSQVQERESPSQSDASQAGRRTQTPQRPENRTQRRPESTEKNCHIL